LSIRRTTKDVRFSAIGRPVTEATASAAPVAPTVRLFTSTTIGATLTRLLWSLFPPELLDAGAIGFLSKPFDEGSLIKSLTDAIKGEINLTKINGALAG
jgi:hypothetical protein